MKKTFLFIAIIALCVVNTQCFAQKKQQFLDVDYTAIEKFVNNQESSYNALVERFITGDTTLTLDEVKMVYYGSYFSPKYDYSDATDEINQSFRDKNYEEALKLLRNELATSPANLELLFMAMVSAIELEEENEKELYTLKLRQLVDVIFSSGDGKSTKTALKVLEVSDEYIIINGVLGARVKQQALVGVCDQMTIYEEDPEETFDLYFDVSLHMKRLNELFGGSSKPAKAKKNRKRK